MCEKKIRRNLCSSSSGSYSPVCQREMLAGGGKMILGSDSHTRYGALGTMAIGEGGPELVKQLLNKDV